MRDEAVESLAKVIIAAAWVDTELTTEDVDFPKDILFRLAASHPDGFVFSEEIGEIYKIAANLFLSKQSVSKPIEKILVERRAI